MQSTELHKKNSNHHQTENLAWEQHIADAWLTDAFGYHCVQLGQPHWDALRANRMPHRWLILQEHPKKLPIRTDFPMKIVRNTHDACAHFAALPFAENVLDAIVLPHCLDESEIPHAILSEAARTLVPEGRLLIFGFNRLSLWGWGYRRLRQSLRQLHLQIDDVQLHNRWQTLPWVDVAGHTLYAVLASKKIQNATALPLKNNWKIKQQLGVYLGNKTAPTADAQNTVAIQKSNQKSN